MVGRSISKSLPAVFCMSLDRGLHEVVDEYKPNYCDWRRIYIAIFINTEWHSTDILLDTHSTDRGWWLDDQQSETGAKLGHNGLHRLMGGVDYDDH